MFLNHSPARCTFNICGFDAEKSIFYILFSQNNGIIQFVCAKLKEGRIKAIKAIKQKKKYITIARLKPPNEQKTQPVTLKSHQPPIWSYDANFQILALSIAMAQYITNLNSLMLEQYEQLYLIESDQYIPTPCSRKIDQEMQKLLIEIGMDFPLTETVINPTHSQNQSIKCEIDGQNQQMVSYANTISTLSSQGESFDISEQIQQNQKGMAHIAQPKSHREEKKFNNYYLGHLDSLISGPWPIFGSSRKYQRSKKGRGSKNFTELEFIARRMRSFKGKKLDTGYPKRFDQQLNKGFRQLEAELQDEYDITPSALRSAIRNKKTGDNQETLNRLIKKCCSLKHWATLLKIWASQEKIDCQDELNC